MSFYIKISILLHISILCLVFLLVFLEKPKKFIEISLVYSKDINQVEKKTKEKEDKVPVPIKDKKELMKKELSKKMLRKENQEVSVKVKKLDINKEIIKGAVVDQLKVASKKSQEKRKSAITPTHINSKVPKVQEKLELTKTIQKADIPKIKEESIPKEKVEKSLDNEIINKHNEDVSNLLDNYQHIDKNNYKSGVKNILESDSLTNAEKSALSQQLRDCVAPIVRNNLDDQTTQLKFTMDKDATVAKIEILRKNKIVPTSKLSKIEFDTIQAFKAPKCLKLILPQHRFKVWKEFTVKLNLKGFFN